MSLCHKLIVIVFSYFSAVGQKRKSESIDSESSVKHICLTPPVSQGLVEIPKHTVYPISTGRIPSPTLTPVAMTMSSQQPLPVQQQAPIFIIYTGQQQLPKNTTQVNGKPLIQTLNGQLLNEAGLLQAQAAGLQVMGGNGLPAQAQILLSAPQTNGIIQQQKRELLYNNHFPTVINGQTVIQAPPPTFVNINGTTALLQQNGHAATILPPRSLISEAVSITPSISPPRLPRKQHMAMAMPRHVTPISIGHRMTRMTPPPLVQVKEEDVAENCIAVGTSRHVTPLSVSTSTSSTQISPKMAVLPFSLIPDSLRAPPTVIKAPPQTRPSLPYILLNEKQNGESPRQVFVKPPSAPSSSSTVPSLYNGNNMPIYRFSTLNNVVQPLQILTSVPSHDSSCVTLPDFIKHDTTIAH